MAEMNFDGRKLKPESHSQEKDNYDRLLAVFHTGTEAKSCLLHFYLRDKTVNLLDWLTSISKHFLQFEDVKKARRKSSIITPKDLGLNTIDTVLKHNCFDLFWDCCLFNTCLEEFLNKHKTMLHKLYLHSSNQHDSLLISNDFTKEQWEFLFERTDCSEIVQKESKGNISACKGITVSSLDSNLNILLLSFHCPLFKAVKSLSDCQRKISETAVLGNEMFIPNMKFDDIWDEIESNILVIGNHCQLYEYFRSCCARIKCSTFNRTLTQDNRKCILEEAFNNPVFIDDKTFCDQVQSELDYIAFEENVILVKQLCERDICVNLHDGQYSRGEYTQSVLENAEKDLILRKSVSSTTIHSKHHEERDKKKETEDIEERCNKHNYLKLVQLINDIGKDVLVDVLKRRLPAVHFGEAFNGMKKRILPLLNNSERQLLYPDDSKYCGDLTDLDISLLYIILRHINTICPHKNGWGNNPEDDDESISANIDRIRMFKNKYVSHSAKCSLNPTEFLTTWKQISKCIIQIDTVYTQRIDNLLTSEINPVIENELCTAIETLKELERERERHNQRFEEKIDHIKEGLVMSNRQRLNHTNVPEVLGYLPLKLKLSGENIPPLREIKPDNFTNEDIHITYIKEGSIIIGLDVSASALKSVGYFLNVIDTLIQGLLKKCSKHDKTKHAPVIISMEFIGLLSEMQSNFHKHKRQQWNAQEKQVKQLFVSKNPSSTNTSAGKNMKDVSITEKLTKITSPDDKFRKVLERLNQREQRLINLTKCLSAKTSTKKHISDLNIVDSDAPIYNLTETSSTKTRTGEHMTDLNTVCSDTESDEDIEERIIQKPMYHLTEPLTADPLTLEDLIDRNAVLRYTKRGDITRRLATCKKLNKRIRKMKIDQEPMRLTKIDLEPRRLTKIDLEPRRLTKIDLEPRRLTPKFNLSGRCMTDLNTVLSDTPMINWSPGTCITDLNTVLSDTKIDQEPMRLTPMSRFEKKPSSSKTRTEKHMTDLNTVGNDTKMSRLKKASITNPLTEKRTIDLNAFHRYTPISRFEKKPSSTKIRTEEHITDMNTVGSDTESDEEIEEQNRQMKMKQRMEQRMKQRMLSLTKSCGTEISTGKHMKDDNDLDSDTTLLGTGFAE